MSDLSNLPQPPRTPAPPPEIAQWMRWVENIVAAIARSAGARTAIESGSYAPGSLDGFTFTASTMQTSVPGSGLPRVVQDGTGIHMYDASGNLMLSFDAVLGIITYLGHIQSSSNPGPGRGGSVINANVIDGSLPAGLVAAGFTSATVYYSTSAAYASGTGLYYQFNNAIGAGYNLTGIVSGSCYFDTVSNAPLVSYADVKGSGSSTLFGDLNLNVPSYTNYSNIAFAVASSVTTGILAITLGANNPVPNAGDQAAWRQQDGGLNGFPARGGSGPQGNYGASYITDVSRIDDWITASTTGSFGGRTYTFIIDYKVTYDRWVDIRYSVVFSAGTTSAGTMTQSISGILPTVARPSTSPSGYSPIGSWLANGSVPGTAYITTAGSIILISIPVGVTSLQGSFPYSAIKPSF